MVLMTKLYKLAALLAVTLLMVACGSIDGEEEQGPAPLVDFDTERKFVKVWSTSVGDGQGYLYNRLTPVVDGETIYVAAADGQVDAISKSTGKTLWSNSVDKFVVGGIGVGENILLLGTVKGEVIALNKSDGELIWTEKVGGEILAAPQTDNARVYVQTFDGQLIGLDIETGERVWSYRHTLPVLTLRGTSTPLIFRNAIIAGFANGQIVSFDAETGAVRWSVRVAVAKGDSEIQRIIDIDSAIFEDNGTVYTVSYQGKVAAIEPASGRKLWSNDASSHVGMSSGFGNIYVSGEDGSVTAFEKSGQGARWAQTVFSRRKLSGSATLSSYVIVGDFDGYIHALSQVDGHIAARTRVDSSGIQVDLQTFDNKLLVYSNDGKLVAYKLEEPK